MVAALEERGEDPIDRRMIDPTKVFARLEALLRDVGLVRVRRDGRRMVCRVDADGLKPLHEWTAMFERLWRKQLIGVKQRPSGAEESGGTQPRPGPARGRRSDNDCCDDWT